MVTTMPRTLGAGVASLLAGVALLCAGVASWPAGGGTPHPARSAPSSRPVATPAKGGTPRPVTPTHATSNGPVVRVRPCRDGTRSYATGRGACSHHGGVAG